MNKKRIERIKNMEVCLDASSAAVKELSDALEKYEEAEDQFYKLAEYYGSMEWMADYEADEAGDLPEDLKRGVLSEDAVYDLLTEHRELMARMQRAVLRSLEEN